MVGSSWGTGAIHAFLWSRAEGMQNLGSLASSNFSQALALNSSGQVVGASQTSLGSRAFIWTQKAGMQDLNTMISETLDVILTAAVHIDDRGRILAVGGLHHDLARDRQLDMDDESHAGPVHLFLLIPAGSSESH